MAKRHRKVQPDADVTEDVYAVVLAAGSSSRFGTTKQLARFRGTPLVEHAVRLAERVCGSRTVLVAGHDWQGVAEACKPLSGFLAINDRYASGMGDSIAVGCCAIADVARAMLLLLADQPLVTVEHLREMVRRWSATPDDLVATGYGATLGPPVIFPARCFARLCELKGDVGARTILAAEANRVHRVRCDAAAIDIDRPEDLDAIS